MGCVASIERTNSQFAIFLTNDVHAEIFGFLEANDQARLRRTSKHFCRIFNHAFQRGYVAAAIHEGYVEKLDTMKEDGDDGHPLLRVAPVDPENLFRRHVWWKKEDALKRSEKDKDATLFVNVRLVLGSGKTVLRENFLQFTSFKAVHLYGTETVTKIERNFLCEAKVQTFTMTTPCPKLLEVGGSWLCDCENLTHFDVSGCCALERVGNQWLSGCAASPRNWLFNCSGLKSASFKGCRKLKRVSDNWMSGCRNLSSVDLGDLVALEEVGACWFSRCSSLCAVDFSPCHKLRVVGVWWVSHCRALKTVDLSACVALERVGNWFLEDTCVKRLVVPKNNNLPRRITAIATSYV